MRVIGLHGRKGAGKDQSFEYIRQACAAEGSHARRVALADPLKISAAAALGVPADRALDFCNTIKQDGFEIKLSDPNGDVIGWVSGRGYLQMYGTEAHREVFSDTFWIDATLPLCGSLDEPAAKLEAQHPGVDVLVVTDVRFENEAQRVWNLGGEVWFIDRPSAEVGDAHASERPLEWEFDVTIVNDAGLDVLANRIIEAL